MKAIEITSKDNEKIKQLKKLAMKKYRQEFGQFLIENATILLDAIRGGFKPTSLFVTQEFIDHDLDRWAEIEQECGLDEYYLIDEKVNKSFSQLDTPAGIGVVFGNDRREPVNLNDKLTLVDPTRIIYLNSISDPGNLGTILRSALAFDLTTIVLDAGCVDVYNPKTIQAARDAIFKLQILTDDPERTILRQIKKQMPIVATALDGHDIQGKDAREGVKSDLFCLVLGNETHGIDSEVRDLADKLIKIKTSDKIESLNVAVVAGILFHQIYN
ncbi:MAG: RNA methyltransferase [Candidatus Uhrbacteria bacterium]